MNGWIWAIIFVIAIAFGVGGMIGLGYAFLDYIIKK